jgi:acetylornithine deacetylase/succinyl-diaminopimelate desuccinylase-like protein
MASRKLVRLSLVLGMICAALIWRSAPADEISPVWKDVEDEATSLLVRYLQIDTTNPPGNELKAAQFFKEIFDREGIEARIIESAPGRGNIYARLRGDGSKKAVALLHHMDVVPADGKLWREPPFGGIVKDGFVWGRGALDMKGPAIFELMTMLMLKRQKTALKGDLIFLGTADEEAGGALGAGYLLEKHPELFANVGLVLNEGGIIALDKDGKVRSYNVSVAEKTPLWLRLTASGTPGHGSTPGKSLAAHKLTAALSRIVAHEEPIKVVPEVQQFYSEIARLESAERRKRYQDLRAALQDSAFAADFVKDPRNNASVRNTIAITRLAGSDKVNVVPAHATAEIDVRLLPGEDPKGFIEGLRRIIADDSIKIDVVLSFPPATSPPHPEGMRVIAELAKTYDGDAPVVTSLTRGFTDCHFFRERGIPCFGFMPRRVTAGGESMVHGIDERISVENLRFGIRAMVEMIGKLVAESSPRGD